MDALQQGGERIPNKAANLNLYFVIIICVCISLTKILYFIYAFCTCVLSLYCSARGDFEKESPATKLSTWRSDCCIDHKSIEKPVPLNEIWWNHPDIFFSIKFAKAMLIFQHKSLRRTSFGLKTS